MVAQGRGGRMGGGARMRRARGFYAGSGYGGYGAYGYAPYDDSDVLYASDFENEPVMEETPPQVVSREPIRATAPVAKPSGPLVLELQGDHWVRMTNDGPPQIVGQAFQASSGASAASSAKGHPVAAKPAAEVLPAVLVYRDGHQEEIGKYQIRGGTISISTDYWSTGSWTRTVQVPELDVPATLKLNQERGTHFRLPSGPNEVMIGG